jgi:hypothetical protein
MTSSVPAVQGKLSSKQVALLVICALTLGVAAVLLTSGQLSANTPVPIGMYTGKEVPQTAAENDNAAVELGIRFAVSQPGAVVGVRFYKSAQNSGVHTGSLWDSAGHRIATGTFSKESRSGWQTLRFSSPVTLKTGVTYVASYHTNTGYYAQQSRQFSNGKTIGNATIRGTRGLYTYGKNTAFPRQTWQDVAYFVDALFVPAGKGVGAPFPVTPTSSITSVVPSASKTTAKATSTASSTSASVTTSATTTSAGPTTTAPTSPSVAPPVLAGSWPGASNTGVPAGTVLKASGGFDITKDGTVVSGLDVNGCINVTAKDVVIKDSRIRVPNSCDAGITNTGGGLTVQDTEIDGQKNPNVGNALGWANITALRLNIHGTGDGMRANGNILIQDSWIHDLYDVGDSHNDGIQVTEGSNITIKHNRIENPNGQTSAIMLGADQGSIANILVDGNFLAGGGYALYGGESPNPGFTIRNIRLTNNAFSTELFKTCGYYGPTTATTDPNITVSGNYWLETGKPVS